MKELLRLTKIWRLKVAQIDKFLFIHMAISPTAAVNALPDYFAVTHVPPS